jgi:protein involved in polysaccharide export with SLBB domain
MKLKYYNFFAVTFLVSAVSAQSMNDLGLDDNFIDSISEEVSKELITESEDSELDQLLKSELSLDKTKILLSRMKDQLKELEARIDKEDQSSTNDLEIFGKYFFQSFQSTFSPINLPNPDGKYVVDVGDKFSITVVGSTDAEIEVMVGRDGYLQIPQYGRVQVAGLELSKVEEKIQSFFTTRALGSESYIQLTSLRDIQVIITGGVNYPGIYTLAGGSNILSAINVAGGISDNGSFRRVQLIRNQRVIDTFDLYRLIISGTQRFASIQLRSGDTININPVSFHVPVTGASNTNAIFELLDGETIKDAVGFAGGFSQYHYGYDYLNLHRAGINGFNSSKIMIKDIGVMQLRPRDSIVIPSFNNEIQKVKYVQVLGRVKNPGKYIIDDDDTLYDLITKAGGYEDDAYIYGGALFRQNAVDKEKAYSQLNYQDTVNFVIANIGTPNTTIDSNIIPLLQEELKSKNYTGRVITEFDLNKIARDPSLDVTLRDQDKLIIPPLDKVIYMFGDFRNPSNLAFNSSLTLTDYIDMAGGLKESAFPAVMIINPDGSTEIFEISGSLAFLKRKPEIYPGSIIYAQRNIGKLDGIQFTATLAPIISSLAISLASLNSISND